MCFGGFSECNERERTRRERRTPPHRGQPPRTLPSPPPPLSLWMARGDAAFKAACAALAATSVVAGAWLAASMVAGYRDASAAIEREKEAKAGGKAVAA